MNSSFRFDSSIFQVLLGLVLIISSFFIEKLIAFIPVLIVGFIWSFNYRRIILTEDKIVLKRFIFTKEISHDDLIYVKVADAFLENTRSLIISSNSGFIFKKISVKWYNSGRLANALELIKDKSKIDTRIKLPKVS